MVVMPGGVDIHSHVAGSSVNLARRLTPDEHQNDPCDAPPFLAEAGARRSGTGGTVPSTFTTGYRYAGLGYTTVFDAAVAPAFARLSHAELEDTPIVDAGFFVLLGNDEFLLRQLAAGETARAREYAAWMVASTGAYGIKVVNPGGVELWKRGARERTELETPVGSSGVTPRRILETLVGAAELLQLPHAAHIHCNNLGVPGNVRTTVESMEAVAGRRAHFTHLQFHSYDATDKGGWRSGAQTLIEYINTHPEVTADVGQVMFGPAMTLTADGPVEYLLHQSSGRKWVNVDIELETGCGMVPYSFKERAAVAALQWVVGLELFLLASDPWRVLLSTDHPNGGSFMAYPELIRLLMDRTYRDEQLRRVNTALLAGSALADGLVARIHAERDCDHHPRRPGPCAGAAQQGPPRRGRRCRRHGVCRGSDMVATVRHPALRRQGRRAGGRRGAAAPGARRPASARAPAVRRGGDAGRRANISTGTAAWRSATIRWASSATRRARAGAGRLTGLDVLC